MSGRRRNRTRSAPAAVVEPVPAPAPEPEAPTDGQVRCELCPREFQGERGLKAHVSRTHNMTWYEYETRPRERVLESPIEKELGIAIDPGALEQALTHRSFAYENGGLPTNERLEFLGDSVLGVVVTTALYRNHPNLPEGPLAKLRASVVNSRALAEVARGIGLGPHLRLGRGEETTGGRNKESILADTLEAVLGAIYLQYDLPIAAEVVHRLFDPVMDQAARLGAGLDWKTSLQELTANRGLGVPDYHIEQTGPDHEKTFTAWAVVAGERFGGVQGKTKKEAEQRAAEAAFNALTADDVLNAAAGKAIVDAAIVDEQDTEPGPSTGDTRPDA